MSNTPFAYAVCSVLHRSVEFKANKRLLDALPIDNLIASASLDLIGKDSFRSILLEVIYGLA